MARTCGPLTRGVAALLAMGLLASCAFGSPDVEAAGAEPERAIYDGEGYRFEHPADWEVIETTEDIDGGEQVRMVRLELPDPDDRDRPQAWLNANLLSSPVDLEAAHDQVVPGDGAPNIHGVEDLELTLPGAVGVLARRFTIEGREDPGREVSAVALVAKPEHAPEILSMSFGVGDDAPLSIDDVRSMVLGTLEFVDPEAGAAPEARD